MCVELPDKRTKPFVAARKKHERCHTSGVKRGPEHLIESTAKRAAVAVDDTFAPAPAVTVSASAVPSAVARTIRQNIMAPACRSDS